MGLTIQGYNRFAVGLVRSYENGRVPINFSEASFNMSMKDHPLTSKMCRQQTGPSIHPGVDQFRPLSSDGMTARTFKDYISKSLPQLCIRVATFTDGTLISIIWPHTMADGRGMAELFRAWSGMLSKESSIPAFMGYDTDALHDFGCGQSIEKSIIEPEGRRMSMIATAFARRAMSFFHESRMESRVFCLPASTIEALYNKAADSMSSFYWVTEADVVKGWATHAICAHLASSARQVCLHSFFDVRERLPDHFPPAVGAYVQNATLPYLTQFPASNLARAPLGDLAVALRKSALQQGTPEQLAATAKLLRVSGMRDAYTRLGDADGHHVYFLDWSAGGLLASIDFGQAVEWRSPDDDRVGVPGSDGTGKPAYFQVDIVSESDLRREDVLSLFGRDPNGDYWFGAVLQRKAMRGPGAGGCLTFIFTTDRNQGCLSGLFG
jgi:Transferase family